MVALAIMAVIAALSWRGVDAMLRLREQTSSHQAATEQLQRVLLQWQADLDAASDSQHLGGLFSPVTFDGQRLTVLRKNYAEPGQPIYAVVWLLADMPKAVQPSGAPQSLLRWQSAPLRTVADLRAANQQAVQLLSDEQLSRQLQAVLPLQAWQVDFFRDGAWVNPQSSAQSSAQTGVLSGAQPTGTAGGAVSAGAVPIPDGVRLTLTLPSRLVDGGTSVESASAAAPAPQSGISPNFPLSGQVLRVWVKPTAGGKS